MSGILNTRNIAKHLFSLVEMHGYRGEDDLEPHSKPTMRSPERTAQNNPTNDYPVPRYIWFLFNEMFDAPTGVLCNCIRPSNGQSCLVITIGNLFYDIICEDSNIERSFWTWGAAVVPSPSDQTAAGRAILAEDPDCLGSLGIAISEAVEVAALNDDTKYSLGSVLNHVLMHQTIIGQEAIKQLEMAGDHPDVIVGCTGGGSNFAGLAFPFIGQQLRGEASARVIAVEPAACPTLTRGPYAFDFGDTAHLAPVVKMHTLGSTFVPPGIHAGGLRYHGMAPLVSHLLDLGYIEPVALHQLDVFAAGVQFARAEGIIPAPESNHAIAAAITEALRCKEEGSEETILFNLSGHGHFDLGAYDRYFAGELEDYAYPVEKVREAMLSVPRV